MATRTVTNTLHRPDGTPLAGVSVTVRLYAQTGGGGVGYDDANDVEILDEKYLTTDSDGAWSVALTANADITPADTVYELVEPGAPLRYFTVAAGAGELWVGDALTDEPGSLASSALSTHIADTSNPHEVTAAQAGADPAGTAAAAVAAHKAAAGEHPISGVSGLQAALDAKADSSAVPDELVDLDTSVTGAELDADHAKLALVEAGATGDQVASEVPFTPAGGVAASDVQAAIEEVDSEKLGATATATNSSLLEGSTLAQVIAAAVAQVVDSAPGALDTLDELAAALGDDANFAATVTNALATKLDIADYDAQSILAAIVDDTPVAVTFAEGTFLGRVTGGNVAALTAAQVKTALAVAIGDVAGLQAALDAKAALAGATFTGPILLPDGTTANPGVGFSGEPGMGLYRSASNVMSLAVGSFERYQVSPTSFQSAASDGPRLENGASTTNPTIIPYRGNINTGIGGDGSNRLSAISAGVEAAGFKDGIIPRNVTTAQRDAIASPATGLVVYNTTTGFFERYTGARWEIATLTPRMKPGSSLWYTQLGGVTTNKPAHGLLQAVRFVVPNKVTVDRLGVNIQADGSAGALVRLGLYDDNEGEPGDLLEDGGTVTAEASGQVNVTISEVCQGIYWAVAVSQGAPATDATYYVNADSFEAIGNPSQGAANGYTQSSVTGALPASFTRGGTTAVVPRILWRVT